MSLRSGVLAVLFTLVLAAPAGAASFVVTNFNDSGPGSLRAAVTAAEVSGDADEITFSVTGTHPVGSELAITKPVTITGNGSGASGTLLDAGAGGVNRVFAISGSTTVTIASLRVSGGSATSTSSEGGGGIRVSGGTTLNLDRVVVQNNFVDGGNDGYGGAGVLATGGTTVLNVTDSQINGNTIGAATNGANAAGIAVYVGATLNLTRSTVSGNSARPDGNGGGGGIYQDGAVTITNSTIAGNHAGTGGGGGITFDAGSLTVLNSTIAGNDAASGGNLGGGIFANASGGTVNVKNSIISGNVSLPATVDNCLVPPLGTSTIVNQGANVENGTTCGFGAASNPMLGPLANYGGGLLTLGLQAGSAAIDKGGAGCPATDQRGVARPQGASCDSGAYELAPPTVATGAATAIGETTATLNAVVGNPDLLGAVTDFEYGTTASYGSTTAATNVAAGASGQVTSVTLTGLTPGTTYHYRANINGAAFTPGADMTFTTATPPGPSTPGGNDDPGGSTGSTPISLNGKPTTTADGVSITVTCPGPGTLTGTLTLLGKARAAAKKKPLLGAAKRTVAAAGKVRLTVKLNKAGKARLKKAGKLKVKLTVAFKPSSGAASTKSVTVTLKRKKPKS